MDIVLYCPVYSLSTSDLAQRCARTLETGSVAWVLIPTRPDEVQELGSEFTDLG